MAILTPMPKMQFFDNNGDPLAGGKLYTYEPGTSTPKATYTDQGGGTPNANPVILDSAGRADVWLIGSYKFRLDDSSDVTIWTVDNINTGGGAGWAKTSESTVSTTLSASNGQSILTASGLIPDNVRVIGVYVEITTTFGNTNGLTGINVGGMGQEDGWGNNIALTATTKTKLKDARRGDMPISSGAQDVTFTAVGGTFDANGQATITVDYITGSA